MSAMDAMMQLATDICYEVQQTDRCVKQLWDSTPLLELTLGNALHSRGISARSEVNLVACEVAWVGMRSRHHACLLCCVHSMRVARVPFLFVLALMMCR